MKAAAAPGPRALKLDHVTLLVTSLERSMPYYARLLALLGFQETSANVWSDGAGFHFQFLQAEPGSRPYERRGAGMNHLGFAATSPEQVHSIRAAMEAAGFPVPEIQQLDGATALFMRDPDGIRFEVSYEPAAAAPDDDTGTA